MGKPDLESPELQAHLTQRFSKEIAIMILENMDFVTEQNYYAFDAVTEDGISYAVDTIYAASEPTGETVVVTDLILIYALPCRPKPLFIDQPTRDYPGRLDILNAFPVNRDHTNQIVDCLIEQMHAD